LKGPPTVDEWRFASGFSTERRERLERLVSSEDIGQAISGDARVRALPIEMGQEGPLRGCRRPIFLVEVGTATFDQFYNGRDGYRGRFWQSPEAGEKANRWLLGQLAGTLVDALGGSPHEAFARKSLSCASATIWFHEDTASGAARLQVDQWEQAAQGESSLSGKAREGRWAPAGTTLEVRGAFLADNGQERIDPDKVERAMEIHLAGYT
jgi:hypothetical protein